MRRPTTILGVSCFFHDSAACLVREGRIVAAAQEERFTRQKHDSSFPVNSINYCLEEARCGEQELDIISFYEQPSLALDRWIRTSVKTTADIDTVRLTRLGSSWGRHRLNLEALIARHVSRFSGKLLFSEHHLSHASSAFFPSSFSEAGVLTVDGVGEWATAAIFTGSGNRLVLNKEMSYPHSLGLLYSAFTYYTGFKVNSGEYKFMGLASYGDPIYYDLLREKVVQINEDGSIYLNMSYFDYLRGDRMTSPAMDGLFGGPPRPASASITKRETDIAASVQKITEQALLKMAVHVRKETSCRNLCLAGGVALNCVANGTILRSGLFDDIWIQPASGDAGGALGAALGAWHLYLGKPRHPAKGRDEMQGALLGNSYTAEEVKDFLELYGFPYEEIPETDVSARIAEILVDGKVVGLFHGRMEYGPRALGNRSILADPRPADMQKRLNLQIKFRESFRPFAPVVMREKMSEWFEMDHDSPYMLLVAPVHQSKRTGATDKLGEDLLERLNRVRSQIPAVTHVDNSARIQTVDERLNPLLHDVLSEFFAQTGVPVLVNTSFNVRGEPIVCTPMDAYRCMMRTEIDFIVLENILVDRRKQPVWSS